MSAVTTQDVFSPEQYLALERNASFKSEFHEGHIYAMTGASREHNLVSINIAGEFRDQLKNRPCEAYLNDMRVKAATARNYFYPDAAVVCGQPVFEDGHHDTMLNPTVLIEVLSPTTEAYDRGDKFRQYRNIASLQEYLLVSQNKPLIERFVRQGDGWVLTAHEGVDAVVTVEAIDCTLALSEVYHKVTFEPEEDSIS